MDNNSGSIVDLNRRRILGLLGAAAGALVSCGRREEGLRRAIGGSALATAATLPSCVVRPEQTEGPFFVEEKLNRADIRPDPSDGSVKQGVPLQLVLQVSRIDGSACAPLSGAVVDIWQCDALGSYSDVRDMSRDTRGKKFLRGYQVTNAGGIAEFLTIYPGWYQGRAVHIHFKIRAHSGLKRPYEFTSQLYFDETITDQVHKQPPYNSRGKRTTTNVTDSLFRRGGKELTLALTKVAPGYAGRFDIGLQII
jgi:protocatechuate 3,4-dioxygenase beta subunit